MHNFLQNVLISALMANPFGAGLHAMPLYFPPMDPPGSLPPGGVSVEGNGSITRSSCT